MTGREDTSWLPLRQLRILDLTRLLPGGFAGSLLADLGADVVKVEPPVGDPLRQVMPETFAAIHRNKRSIMLDLAEPEGKRAFLALVPRFDVVIESHRPGVLDRLGLGFAALRRANPRVVLCSLSGFGQTGPYSRRPGHDVNFLALSGFFAVPQRPTGSVDRPGVRVADLAGAMYAALSITVAAQHAATTGTGQHVDVSLHEAAAAWAGPLALPALNGAAVNSPLVTGDNDAFTTRDGRRLSLALFEDKFWRAFRERLAGEFPALATDAYDRRRDRTRHKEAVSALLAAVFADRDLKWWIEVLGELDVPWAPVHETAAAVVDDEHVQARELITEVPGGPEDQRWHQVRFPVVFGAGLDSFRTPAPDLGEHTAEVLESNGPRS
ncbi:CaiB/BaiF CoA transferase family protein [Streptomyces uncialis]|uniref:Acyl-CoA hydratase n=1 Tax=Streptomyces uncialis TaxID=1048205 RepID=A0A1Q4V2T9_9ACTN|nr:CoA transferase [Streptomyces uncialis]MCX4657956.1 CoA transferase [Streptomyces uncialis]OKH92136.1 acyl-CoA hydratase [Streptomyces uncialis]